VARPFIPKLQQRVRDAEVLLKGLPRRTQGSSRIWIHAASMGELEQCVPVMNLLSTHSPKIEIIVSCSSPSGIRHAAALPMCVGVVYHPFENRNEIRRTIDIVQPDVVVIDRYDVWPMFIDELHERGVPTVLMNATFPSAGRTRLMSSTIAATYAMLSSITAVTADDASALSELLERKVETQPDSRIDRILDRVDNASPSLTYLRRTVPTIVIGSSWDEDLEIIIPAITSLPADALRVIIVPHEPTESTLASIETKLLCTRLSNATATTQGPIVVDSVGMLLSLYRLADAAYVGGGLGAGVHSVLEPAGYGLPLACGPRIDRSRDAVALVESEACTIVTSVSEVSSWIHNIVLSAVEREQRGAVAREYLTSQTGSSRYYANAIMAHLTA
jgi:3-deoxy-D-manno-octulosonic-acid transferase